MDQWGSEILVFEIDGRRYGLPAAQVRELVRVVTIVPLPRSRAFVEGVVNLRGQVVPVLDLRARLGLPPREAVPSDHLVIARASDRTVAIRVDRALELRSPDLAAIDAVEGISEGAIGVACLPDGLVPILDLSHFLPGADEAGPDDPPDHGGPLMSWSNPAFAMLADLIATRTGLVFGPDRRARAEIGVRRAMDRAGEPCPDTYARRVARDPALLDDLLIELTVGETYFFREPGQFEFIRREALPEIRRRRGVDHSIRVWSAGCASGEEAYSLAMLLDREGLTGPIPVLATDISRGALTKARRAIYTDWSLRGEGAGDAHLYLRKAEGRHVVVDSIRGRVAFEHLNLALDVYPSYATGTCGIDLILCRNVLIYLDPETVQAVARRLFAALAEGGWLIAASSDPPLSGLAPFEVVVAEEGIFYRRSSASGLPDDSSSDTPVRLVNARNAAFPEAIAPRVSGTRWMAGTTLGQPSAPRVEVNRDAVLAAAREDLARGDYDHAADRTRGLVHDAEAAAIHVRALANLDPDRAERACGAAITSHPFSAELYHLRTVLLMSLGRDAEAARAARRVIYLDRSLAIAHFLLGSILCRGGDQAGAWRAFRNARDLCAARPPDEAVPLADGEPAGGLADTISRQMARLVAPIEAAP